MVLVEFVLACAAPVVAVAVTVAAVHVGSSDETPSKDAGQPLGLTSVTRKSAGMLFSRPPRMEVPSLR